MSIGAFLKVVWTTPTVLLCMGAFMFDNFVGMVLLSWMSAFPYEKFQLNLAMAGLTATLFVQLASMLGSPVGGWMADSLRQGFPGGRIAVQVIGLLGAVPFVIWCGQTLSVTSLIVALTCWGFFKGLYDANIFASVLDVVLPEARGTAVGFMNLVGWLVGAGTAPVVIGYIAQRESLSYAISVASVALVCGALLFVPLANSDLPDTMEVAHSRPTFTQYRVIRVAPVRFVDVPVPRSLTSRDPCSPPSACCRAKVSSEAETQAGRSAFLGWTV